MVSSPVYIHRTGRAKFLAIALLIWLFGSTAEFSRAQSVGTCTIGAATSVLDANNVLAPILLGGALFFPPNVPRYQVPRFSTISTIFAGNFAIFGKRDDELRGAGTVFGNNEFWPGPLEDDGSSPSDCAIYDRIYKVEKNDIDVYEATGVASADLAAWPTGLGAPTINSSGNPVDLSSLPLDERRNRVIDLQNGERPSITGVQSHWWTMQDMGNRHEKSLLEPLGIEIHALVSAAPSIDDAIGHATILEYRIINKSAFRIDSTYVGLFFDLDLGYPWDDYVGSDTLRNLGYTYNADNEDGDNGRFGFLDKPPALGIRILRGPLAISDGLDNDYDGMIDEPDERLGMTNFMPIYKNDFVRGSPLTGEEYFLNFQSRWHDGKVLREGGNGYASEGKRIRFGFPGNPVTSGFWTEENLDGSGTRASDGRDRRLIMSTGPFTLEPGEETEFSFAIVWGLGRDRLDSITRMKQASDAVRDAFENGYSGFTNGPVPSDLVELFSPATGARNQPDELNLRWAENLNAPGYQIALTVSGATRYLQTTATSLQIRNLTRGSDYSWKVRLVNRFGSGPWSDENIFTTGHIEFADARPFISSIITTGNADGILSPPDLASRTYVGPCPTNPADTCPSPTPFYQQSTSGLTWLLEFGTWYKPIGPVIDPTSRLGSLTDSGHNVEAFFGYDFEIRFKGVNGKAAILGDLNTLVTVPFEIWNVGQSDDSGDESFRLIPILCESACEAGGIDGMFDLGDSKSDRIFWYEPMDVSAGTAGYRAFIAGDRRLGREVFADMYLERIQARNSNQPFNNSNSPEPGTVFRIESSAGFTPVLSSPKNGAIFGSGRRGLYWEGSERDAYRVQLSLDATFDTILLETTPTTDGFTTIDVARGRYFWRVIGSTALASEIRSFEIANRPDETNTIGSFQVFGNYPNPFSGITTIGYDIPEPAPLKMSVYDMLGRLVYQTLLPGPIAGYQTVQFDGSELAVGSYLYRITDGIQAQSKMMIVVR